MSPACLALCLTAQKIRPGVKTLTPVLTYHDVIARRGKGSAWFDCTVGEFKSQLDWMSHRGAHFIAAQALYDHLAKGAKLPSHAVVLTFADNYLGFYKYAVPVLRARHIPAIQFVHSGFVGSRVGRAKLTWEQLKEVSKDPLFTIGSQTVTHPPDLSKLTETRLTEEFVDSKAKLSSELGAPVDFLAYPNGKFDARCARTAERCGYKMAFTEEWKPAERSPGLFQVGRYVHTQYKRAWFDAYGVPSRQNG